MLAVLSRYKRLHSVIFGCTATQSNEMAGRNNGSQMSHTLDTEPG